MQPKRLAKTKKAGRPPTLTMPEPIDDTIENVMDAVLTHPAEEAKRVEILAASTQIHEP